MISPTKASSVTSGSSFLGQENLSLIVFGGKGGVGKTTCAAAAALHWVRRAPRCFYVAVSIDPAHSLRDSFAGSPLPPNLKVEEVDAGECLRRFKNAHAEHLRLIALRGTILDDEDISLLLDLSLPGLDEVMAFSEISALAEKGEYACIIVDTAPTGHTLRFLELPQTLRRWLEALDSMMAKHRFMSRMYAKSYRPDAADAFLTDMTAVVERLASLFADHNRCRFVPVMTADVLSIEETRRLLHRLMAMKTAVVDVLVNRLFRRDKVCPPCQAVGRRQRTLLDRLPAEFAACRLWGIPAQGGEVQGSEQLGCFWDDVRPIQKSDEEAGEDAAAHCRVVPAANLPKEGLAVLIFAGKGGVGKTTLATGTALRLARQYPGREVLLFSSDPAHSVSDCLNIRVGPNEVRLCPGLTAVEIDAEAKFLELKRRYAEDVAAFFEVLGRKGGVDVPFDREVVERMMDLSPAGLDEVMALTRAMELMGSGKYHMLVLDSAPTGHLIRLLALPKLIEEWLKVFFNILLKYRTVFRLPRISGLLVSMSKQVKALRAILADPDKANLYAVSLLTEMAFQETCDLLAACRRAGIRVPVLFLNLATPGGGCPLCDDLVRVESRVLHEFQSSFPDIAQSVVYRCGEPHGMDRLTDLGDALYVEEQTPATRTDVLPKPNGRMSNRPLR